MAEVIYAKDKEKIGYENGRGYDSSNTGWTTLKLDGQIWKYGSISYTNAISVNSRKHRFVILWRTIKDDNNPGKTTLNWRLYAKIDGDGTASDEVDVVFTLYLDHTDKEECTRKESVIFKQGFNDGNLVQEGFKDYYHNDEGEGYFTWYAAFKIGVHDASKGRRIYFNEDKPRTACQWSDSAHVQVTPKIVKPTENIEISWDPDAVTLGEKNSIAGYQIKYKTGENQEWTKIWETQDASCSSYTWEHGQSRGTIIEIQLIVKNTHEANAKGDLFGESSRTEPGIRINQLPSSPEVTCKVQRYSSTTNKIEFKISPFTDDDGDVCSIQYSTSDDGSRTEFKPENGKTLSTTLDKTTTFYFWSHDGHEFSKDPTELTITKNTRPTLDIEIEKNPEKGVFKNIITATKNDNGTADGNTYTYGYYYNGVHYEYGNTDNTQYEAPDIRVFLSNYHNGLEQERAYTFQYWAKRTDALEESEIKYSEQLAFQVPKLQLTVKLPENKVDNRKQFDQNVIISLTGKYEDQENYYCPLGERNFGDIVLPGQQLSQVEFRREEASEAFFINLPQGERLTRIQRFVFEGVSVPLFYPYADSAMTFSIRGKDALYGFRQHPRLIIQDGNDNDDDKKIFDIAPNPSNTPDSWSYTLTPEHLWKASEDTDYKGLAGSVVGPGEQTKKITFKVTNDFGYTTSTQVNLRFNFSSTLEIQNFEIGKGLTGIKENTQLPFSGTILHHGPLSFKIIENATPKNICNESEATNQFNTIPWKKNKANGWEPNPLVYNLSDYYSKLTVKPKYGPISQSYKSKFSIIATSTEQTDTVDSKEFNFYRHTNPHIHFTSLSYADDKLSGSYVIDDLGCDGANGKFTKISLIDESEVESIIWEPDEEIKVLDREMNKIYNFEINYEFGEGLAFKQFAPSCVSVYQLRKEEEEEETSYTTNSYAYLVVYNVLPTISYRQNYIGINTKDPLFNNDKKLLNPALTVSAYNKHSMIHLVSNERQSSINLLTGAQDGFVINCGIWDDSPYDPKIPTANNLAQVAYTGLLSDLEQTTEVIVVIRGGGAPSS